MADPAQDVASRAMQLPTKARARLAELLLSSLDTGDDCGAEALWLKEAERRLAELESGEVASLSAEGVFKELRSLLR